MSFSIRSPLPAAAVVIAAALLAAPAAQAQVKLRYAHVGVANAPQTMFADELAKIRDPLLRSVILARYQTQLDHFGGPRSHREVDTPPIECSSERGRLPYTHSMAHAAPMRAEHSIWRVAPDVDQW